MTKPVISTFASIAPLLVQPYERYLPTAFDESMSLLQKVNKIIKYVDALGLATNDLVTQWNEVMDWVMNDGLNESVIAKLDELVADGTLERLINQEILNDIKDQISGIAINIKYPPTPLLGCKVDGVTNDTQNLKAIIKYAEDNGHVKILIPGICRIDSGEIEIRKSMIIQGIGSGSAYGEQTIGNYKQISGFYVTGTAERQIVRTRSTFRGSSSDPQDKTLSVVLNVQAEQVLLKDFSIVLQVDTTILDSTNYGTYRDVGIFIGCRVQNWLENVHVIGYFREASIYLDVTRASNLPQFTAIDGTSYDAGTTPNGADGLTMNRVFTYGGNWGLKIQGAKPKAGQTTYTDAYYDQLLGYTVTDSRGNFGASDITVSECQLYGFNHHTKKRKDDATGNYLTDNGGGSVSIDGLAGNASGVLQGIRFISTRFMSWEPFRIKLDRVNRVILIGCHSEWGSGAMTHNGTLLLLDDTDIYGPISTTANTQNTSIYGFNARIRDAFIGSNPLTLLGSGNDADNQFEQGITTKKTLTTLGNINTGGSVIATVGDIDLRSSATGKIRGRIGSVTRFLVDLINTNVYGNVLPDVDNVNTLGNLTNRFTNGHFTNGVVVTTPDGTKKYLIRVDDSGNVITQLQ